MNHSIISQIKNGKVGVIPTDTLYGLIGSALNQETVKRIYQTKDRSENKPFIILISSPEDLTLFDIQLDEKTKTFLQKLWPNPISVIFDCPDDKLAYLHQGTRSLAFRVPKDKKLLEILEQTGPLVAPSANPEGKPPAQTIKEAKQYFGNGVDFYVDNGKLTSLPSTLIKIEGRQVTILRQGVFQLPPDLY